MVHLQIVFVLIYEYRFKSVFLQSLCVREVDNEEELGNRRLVFHSSLFRLIEIEKLIME